MKLFVFYPNYPNDYCRMYVMSESAKNVIFKAEELFEDYMKADCGYIDLNDPDEQGYIEEKRVLFMKGVYNICECPDGRAVDLHY